MRAAPDVESAAEAAPDPHDYVIVTLGHELRNPLGAIRAAAAVIERSLDRARRVIERQVATAEALIEDLSELSRAQRGTLRLRYSAVTIGALIQDGLEAAAHLTSAATHRVHVAHGEPDVILRVDRPPSGESARQSAAQ